MLRQPAATEWGFPRAVAGVDLLVRYAAAHGVPATRALAGSGLPADRRAADQMVTAAQELTVTRNLRRILGDVGADVAAPTGRSPSVCSASRCSAAARCSTR